MLISSQLLASPQEHIQASALWNQCDRQKKGQFCLVIRPCSGSTWEAAWGGEGGQTGSLSHSSWRRVGTALAGALLFSRVGTGSGHLRVGRGSAHLNSDGEKMQQCFAHQQASVLLSRFSTLLLISMQCASVGCAVPNVILHKIMIMPECVEDGSTCQYIWHFEQSEFDIIRRKMFETHNRSGMHFHWASS